MPYIDKVPSKQIALQLATSFRENYSAIRKLKAFSLYHSDFNWQRDIDEPNLTQLLLIDRRFLWKGYRLLTDVETRRKIEFRFGLVVLKMLSWWGENMF